MRAALTNEYFLDLRAADRARCTFPIIHPKIILELASAISPINGCAIAADACLQDLSYRFMQRLRLFHRH